VRLSVSSRGRPSGVTSPRTLCTKTRGPCTFPLAVLRSRTYHSFLSGLGRWRRRCVVHGPLSERSSSRQRGYCKEEARADLSKDRGRERLVRSDPKAAAHGALWVFRAVRDCGVLVTRWKLALLIRGAGDSGLKDGLGSEKWRSQGSHLPRPVRPVCLFDFAVECPVRASGRGPMRPSTYAIIIIV